MNLSPADQRKVRELDLVMLLLTVLDCATITDTLYERIETTVGAEQPETTDARILELEGLLLTALDNGSMSDRLRGRIQTAVRPAT